MKKLLVILLVVSLLGIEVSDVFADDPIPITNPFDCAIYDPATGEMDWVPCPQPSSPAVEVPHVQPSGVIFYTIVRVSVQQIMEMVKAKL